jgi:hypothetical protein
LTERRSHLKNVYLNDAVAIFIVGNQRALKTPLQSALDRSLPNFGDGLGARGNLVIENPGAPETTFDLELIRLPWTDQLRDRLQTEDHPYLLIIKKDFTDFNPSEDPWRLVWFSDAQGPKDSIPQLFDALLRSVERNQDPFVYLDAQTNDGLTTAPFGSLSSPAQPAAPTWDRQPGRTPIDKHLEVIERKAAELIKAGRITPGDYGWKGQLIRLLKRHVAAIAGYQDQSIHRSMRRSGLFEKLEQKHT